MISTYQEDVERWLGKVCQQIEIPQARLEYQSFSTSGGEPAIQRIDAAEGTAAFRPKGRHAEVAWQSMIQSGTRPLGYLQVQISSPEILERHFLRACNLADQISRMAVQYAGLLDSFQEVHQQQSQRLTQAVLEQVTVQTVVENALKSLVQFTSYRGVAFFLLDAEGASLQLKHYLHDSLDVMEICQRDLLSADYDRQALLTGKAVCHRRHPRESQWLPADVQTGLCVRVPHQDGVLGTLWAYDRRVRLVEDRDLHVVQSIATQLGTLLDQAVANLNPASPQRMKTELKLASVTQPAQTVEYHSPAGELSAAGRCLSQFDVGGDLCEVIPLGDDFVFVMVGDASGNSIPAAMVMTAVRGASHALLSEIRETLETEEIDVTEILKPALFMQRLNRTLTGMIESDQFMSCICGLFNLRTQELIYCNAGHPSPIHLSGDQLEYLPSHGLLLGIDASVEYEQDKLLYREGDVIVFYSDGISEAMGQSQRMFRQDGIAAAAQKHQHESAAEIMAAIWNQMLAHQQDHSESDDATLLAVKVAAKSLPA